MSLLESLQLNPADLSARLAAARVLVVGDVMLDRYWFGEVNRISPEAPVPVAKISRIEERAGGAANVHRAQHLPGERATSAFEATRDKAARWLNTASREEIVFTRGTTESLNLLAYGLEPLFQVVIVPRALVQRDGGVA